MFRLPRVMDPAGSATAFHTSLPLPRGHGPGMLPLHKCCSGGTRAKNCQTQAVKKPISFLYTAKKGPWSFMKVVVYCPPENWRCFCCICYTNIHSVCLTWSHSVQKEPVSCACFLFGFSGLQINLNPSLSKLSSFLGIR